MISDFIEANNLGARVLSFPSDCSLAHALKAAHLSENSAAKAVPFVDEKMDFFVVIAAESEAVLVVDAEELFGVPLEVAVDNEVLKITGFERKFFPPIGVFGVKVAFHNSILKQKTLLFCLSPREYLIISKGDIEKSVEINDPLI